MGRLGARLVLELPTVGPRPAGQRLAVTFGLQI